MSKFSFTVGQKYKREQVSQIAGDGGDIGGNWATGYPSKDGVTFIFANVGNPGQTGHDYDNFFDGPDLVWRGRNGSTRHHASIVRMTRPGAVVHVFWRAGGRDLFTYAGLGAAVETTDEIPVRVRWKLNAHNSIETGLEAIRRLPVEELSKVRPEHVWEAVEALLGGFKNHPFYPSTDYDVVTEDGKRLPPKAVFGIAATNALGFSVGPYHFTAGVSSPCFRIIENAGYKIVSKDEPALSISLADLDEQFWSEGRTKLVTHRKRERSPAATKAKKSQFKQKHGKLFCEKCGLCPVEHYGTEHAESVIEVHHRTVQVQAMTPEHRTTLDMLQCLCANCHRLEHRLLTQLTDLGTDLSPPAKDDNLSY
ncbi:HNH endonuclease [Pseudoduganella lutea]|uniref:HNH endonuclease n=1 Tax=Pseudoduganella lutea TaxID=321985 RepID=A0A4P6KZ84_9BURK|nr:hypothetical protein [Pseudoduganella lutea]QBE64277.1 hypothetical protein EWM63_15840 [Pseudoduganella lutea]